MPKIIKMIIKNDGSILVDLDGYVGQSCVKDVEQLINKLKEAGIDVNISESNLKEEAYLSEAETEERETT